MTEYEECYRNYLAWLAPRELVHELHRSWLPWKFRERKWIKEEIESRCTY